MVEPVTYRDPARTRPVRALERVYTSCAPRSAALLGAIALGGVASAVLAGSPELLLLAGAGVLAAAAQWAVAHAAGRRQRGLARFFGAERITLTSVGWCSLDGTRRLRARAGDRLARFEHLDPSNGQTLASFRAGTPVMPLAVGHASRRVLSAVVAGRRPLAPCCFVGAPPEIGGDATLPSVERVIVSVLADGVLVERCDADGVLVGDTWHLDLPAAQEQLAREYGPHVGELEPLGETSAAVERPRAWTWERRRGVPL